MTCRRFGLAGVAIGCFCGSAIAQPFDYGDFPGGRPTDPMILSVTEVTADGVSRFNRPTRAGNSLLFFPTDFSAVANGAGGSQVTSSTLIMEILAAPGTRLGEFAIREFGDWQLTGVGSAGTSVSASGFLSIDELAPGPPGSIVDQEPLSVAPLMPLDLGSRGAGGGLWDGEIEIDLTPLDLIRIRLEFTASLSAQSEDGTSALIQRKVSQIPSIQPALIIDVPAPGAGLLIATAGPIVLCRRRR